MKAAEAVKEMPIESALAELNHSALNTLSVFIQCTKVHCLCELVCPDIKWEGERWAGGAAVLLYW